MSPAEARRVYAAAKGPKTIKIFEDLGHVSFASERPAVWRRIVKDFLKPVLD